MLQTRSSILLVAQTNTSAGGSAVIISNSSNIFITNTSLTVLVQNSAGWVISASATILNSAGWVVSASATILNSAGWIVNVANTGGTVFLGPGSGLIGTMNIIAQGTGASTNIINSAGWVVSMANTANLAIYALDSAATGSVVSAVASTVGTVVLAGAQTKRVALSLYNASVNPLFMKFGSGAKVTDFTLMMVASGYYEMARPIYNGQITGVWVTANGTCYVTETT